MSATLSRRSRGMAILVGLLVVLALLTAASAAAAQTRTDRLLAPAGFCSSADLSSPGQLAAMACLVGYARAQAGVSKLRESKTLALAGTLKLDADLQCATFTHTPCGQPFEQVFATAGFSLAGAYSVGENLAYGQSSYGSAQQIMQGWLASPEHRKNLLSTSWTTFGLALQQNMTFLGIANVALWANEFASS